MIRNALERGLKEAGIDLPETAVDQLTTYAEELGKWNRKINLTAITRDEEVAAKHLVDSLVLARFLGQCSRLLDIGSGAGLPAVPLKVARPEVEVVSVDAVGKKINFQRHIGRLLGLTGFTALHSRVEELKDHDNSFDVITSRAFSDLSLFVRLGVPLLSAEGRIIAMKGPADPEALGREDALLREAGFEIREVFPYQLPFGSGARSLIVIHRLK